jgi:GNAT superfamily N-acetyltransferase
MPDGDFTRFIASPEAVDAWVATRHDAVLGHVALHRTSSPAVIDLATTKLAVEATRLGVVARLLVAPDARRAGMGRLLLERAASEAHDRGLRPILDVTTRFEAAVSLYERSGWQRLGAVVVELPNGTSIDEFVYHAPHPDFPDC